MLQIKRSELRQLAQNKLGNTSLKSQNKILVMISTALAARTSYTVVGDEKEINYERLIKLHDLLIEQDPPHSSPLEHSAKCMNNDEYNSYFKGKSNENWSSDLVTDDTYEISAQFDTKALGWCGPYRGFISYRYFIDNKINAFN